MGAVALNTREKADSFLSWKWNPSVRATGADCYRVVRLEHHYLAEEGAADGHRPAQQRRLRPQSPPSLSPCRQASVHALDAE